MFLVWNWNSLKWNVRRIKCNDRLKRVRLRMKEIEEFFKKEVQKDGEGEKYKVRLIFTLRCIGMFGSRIYHGHQHATRCKYISMELFKRTLLSFCSCYTSVFCFFGIGTKWMNFNLERERRRERDEKFNTMNTESFSVTHHNFIESVDVHKWKCLSLVRFFLISHCLTLIQFWLCYFTIHHPLF